jgi:hypothetical protein
MMPCWCDERHDPVVVCHDIIFGNAQVEIEDVEEFTLDPANVALAKYTGAHSPVYVFER